MFEKQQLNPWKIIYRKGVYVYSPAMRLHVLTINVILIDRKKKWSSDVTQRERNMQ